MDNVYWKQWQEQLQTACKKFVAKTDKLVREYQRDWIELENDWQYERLSESDWFNQKERDKFYEHFIDPFFEEHLELNSDDDNVFKVVEETLREEMYNQDKYECIIL